MPNRLITLVRLTGASLSGQPLCSEQLPAAVVADPNDRLL